MSENMFVYTVGIAKYGETEPFDKLVFAGMSPLHVSHLVEDYIWGNEELDMKQKYDFPVEVVSVARVVGLGKIENMSMRFDEMDDEELEDPYVTDGESQDDVMKFKHSCNTSLSLRDTGFDWVKCSGCGEIIQREEIQNISGIWCFIPSGNKKKK